MAAPGGRHRLGPGSGHLLVHTRREGLAAKIGHDLTIEITDWSADVEVPDDPAQTRLTVRVGLGSLAVREGTGGAAPLTDADRREIRRNADKALAVDRYPAAVFTADRVQPGAGVVDGRLTLHGVTRPVQLRVSRVGPGRYRGTATVTQSEYGIRPYSAFLGALRIRDAVAVEFEVDVGRAVP
ncbi:MAG TPA: YceI family protein [Planosporangium sp.]|jgi:polyisoprenoid-binding protein YceI|nr:YceI family protein [Planosporangium sp.]